MAPLLKRSTPLLSEWLKATGDAPWEWGKNDCGIWVADWIKARRAIDVAAPWRGRYDSAKGCHDIVKAAGGYINLVRERMWQMNIPETSSPDIGDVGLVRFHEARPTAYVGSMMGIFDGSLWVVKMNHGLACGNYQYLLAWRI